MVRAPVGGCRIADPNFAVRYFFVFRPATAKSRMQEAPKSNPNVPSSRGLVDRERIAAVIDPVVRAHGAELVDLELTNETGWILRVYVEKLGASAERMSTK